MMKRMKGITPVIAIVLLLLVTVGAVGVVYTQFQNIANQGNTNFNTKAKQVELTVNSISQNSNNNNSMSLTFTNGQQGSSVQFNQTRMLQISFVPENGQSGVLFQTLASGNFETLTVANSSFPGDVPAADQPATECFNIDALEQDSEQIVNAGETVTCDTNVKFPEATKPISVIVSVSGTSKQWEYNCDPTTSDSMTC